MKAADVRAMSADQLNDELAKLKKEQFNLRFQKATGQLEKSSRIQEVRRDIARVKTIARQKAAEVSVMLACLSAARRGFTCRLDGLRQEGR